MAEKNYAREWYEYGREHNDDPIVKFMLHWVAFNWLYSEYFYTRYARDEETQEGRIADTQKIKAFCNANYEILAEYDAFDRDEVEIFMKDAVHDVSTGRRKEGLFKELTQARKNSRKQIECLFLTFYQVRCNLFHGSKSLIDERDINLVKAASVLLDGYLQEVLNKLYK